MKIGIVTVLNTIDGLTDGFVSCINAQRFRNFEIFLLENDGLNARREALIRSKLNVPFTLVRSPRNGNAATAINLGIDHFLADNSFTHILFLSNDAEVSPLFLDRYSNIMRANSKVDVLAAKILHPSRAGKILYAGGKLSYVKGGFKYFDRKKIEKVLSRTLSRVTYAPNSSLMIKAWLLKDSGVRMWDELFICHDNTIFCHELQQAGFRMYVTPKIEVNCRPFSIDGKTIPEESRYYTTRNWLYWGIRRRNFAVLTSALFLFAFYTAVRNTVEREAMADAFRMTRSAKTMLSRAQV